MYIHVIMVGCEGVGYIFCLIITTILCACGIGQCQDEEETGYDNIDLRYDDVNDIPDTTGEEIPRKASETIYRITDIKEMEVKKEMDECAICCDDCHEGEVITVLVCQHFYHMDCINEWIKVKRSCPKCYIPISVVKVTC